ncbi:MAG TPA: ATP-binding cassette domain-containing protein, partial [Stellaceae bacterium]|nr:ATP-binding cassette domain-containing protein [Stellaceae bacterium]
MSALELRGLAKSFGGLRVTANINLDIAPGERRLIIGPNGAGKTTLFNLVTGELRPDGGSVRLFGRDITYAPSRRRAHLGLARTYQIITLFPRETLLGNVMLSLLGLSSLRWNCFARFDRQTAVVARAREALERVGLDALAHRTL